MTDWTMAQAKRDFSIGYLTGYGFERFTLGGVSSWYVRLSGGSARGSLVDARSKQVREFRSLDAAVRAVEEIGFKVESLTVGSI